MAEQPRPLAVGVVYAPDGTPRIEKDFVDHLQPSVRAIVRADLERHGWRLTDQNTVERL